MQTGIDWQHYEQVMQLKRKFYEQFHVYWYTENLWTYQWWILLGITIIPWWIWWRVVDKRRVVELFTFSIIIGTMAVTMDCIGSNCMVWDYPVRLVSYWYPELWPYDIGAVPLPFTLVQQYTKTPKQFYSWMAVVAAGMAFIAEPVMSLLHMYELFSWKYMYSFPIYFMLGCLARQIVLLCLRLESVGYEQAQAD